MDSTRIAPPSSGLIILKLLPLAGANPAAVNPPGLSGDSAGAGLNLPPDAPDNQPFGPPDQAPT